MALGADIRSEESQEILSRLPEGTQGYAYVASMAVDKSYRRQGVALAMLEQAEQVAGTFVHNTLDAKP